MIPERIPLDPRRVLLHVDAPDRSALLDALCAALATAEALPPGVDASALRAQVDRALDDRPAARTEALVALALRVEGLAGLRIAVATLARPLVWDSRPAQVVVLVAMPLENPAPGLRVINEWVELLADSDRLHHLLGSRSAPDVARWLERHLSEDEGPLLARDLMRPSYGRLGPETPIADITRLLVAHNLDCAGITDDNRRLLGQVTADGVFTLGLPDFFRQLKSVAFIAEFDPLERYFRQERGLTAKDVMSTDLATCAPTATLLEVLFLLSVKGYPKVFVVDDDNRLLGVIDRIRLLDRVVNL
jgi:CBS domain-containing protein